MMVRGLITVPCLHGLQMRALLMLRHQHKLTTHYNDSDYGFETLTSPWVHRNGIDAAIDIVCERAGGRPVYLSFDIDG